MEEVTSVRWYSQLRNKTSAHYIAGNSDWHLGSVAPPRWEEPVEVAWAANQDVGIFQDACWLTSGVTPAPGQTSIQPVSQKRILRNLQRCNTGILVQLHHPFRQVHKQVTKKKKSYTLQQRLAQGQSIELWVTAVCGPRQWCYLVWCLCEHSTWTQMVKVCSHHWSNGSNLLWEGPFIHPLHALAGWFNRSHSNILKILSL